MASRKKVPPADLVVTVRKGLPSDAPLIAAFNQRLAEESEGRRLDPDIIGPGVDAVLADPNKGVYWLAEVDGAVAGQLMITTEWSDWRNGWFWWIQSVFVAPAFRNRGVYRSLHTHVARVAQAAGDVRGLRLYVEHHNEKARATYERLGMTVTHYHLMETDWSGAVADA